MIRESRVNRLVAALTLALCAAGCPGGGAAAGPRGGDLAAIKARGTLVVAMDVGYDPFETLQPDGSFAGFDVDLVHEVCKDLGVKPELKNVAWVGITSELLTGKVDAIFSGMSITEERRQAVAFSQPYYEVGQVVVKRKGDARIRSHADLNAAGMRVATQAGTTGEQAIKDFMPKAESLRFPKTDEACLALIQGKADAVVFDHPFLIKYVTQQTDQLEGLWEPFKKEQIAAALRPDSQALVQAIDATITRLRASGEMAKLEAKWFPAMPGAAATPPAATTTPPPDGK